MQDDPDTLARYLVTHLAQAILASLVDHDPGRMDAVDYSRFLGGEVRQKIQAIEERIANVLEPIGLDADDPELRKAAGRRSVRAYLRRQARAGEYVRTTAGLRRVVEQKE